MGLSRGGFFMTQAVRHDSMRARNLAVVLGEVRSERSDHARGPGGDHRADQDHRVEDGRRPDRRGHGHRIGRAQGRRAGTAGTAVSLSGERVAALGLEINVDYLSACVVDLTRSVRLRYTQAVDNRTAPPVETLAHLQKLFPKAVDEARSEGLSIAGSTLAVPGPVDGGRLHSAPNLGWHDVARRRVARTFPRLWTTRPTSPPSASSGSAPVRGTSSTSRGRWASAPASWSAARCSAAPAGSPESWDT